MDQEPFWYLISGFTTETKGFSRGPGEEHLAG